MIFTILNFKLGGPIGEPAFKKCEQDCKFHFESSGDTLKSINFPGHYQPFSDCKWTLEGPRGHRIVFQVIKLFKICHRKILSKETYSKT